MHLCQRLHIFPGRPMINSFLRTQTMKYRVRRCDVAHRHEENTNNHQTRAKKKQIYAM